MSQKFQVEVIGEGQVFSCSSEESVLAAYEKASPSNRLIGCRMGGCGICRVKVVAGDYDSGKMSKAQVSVEDQAQGIVLACKIYPRSDIRMEILGLK